MMALEDEIPQKRFKHEHQKVVINVLHTANWINQQNTERLRPFGVTPQQFNILGILRGLYPEAQSVNLLRDHMLFRESNVSRLVEKLRRRGLVERIPDPQDRRAVRVSIAAAGLELMQGIDWTEPDWLKKLKALPESEARELNRLLDKLRSRRTD